AKSTEVIDEGISGLARLLKRTSSDDEESILRSRQIFEQFSKTADSGIDSLKGMRDVVAGMKDMSKEVSRASRRLAAAIDGIIENIAKVEVFALKMLSIIDRLLEQEAAS